MNKIIVDDGFVELVDSMGNDLSIVNAARGSFAIRKTKLDEKDITLLKYLLEHKHMSPFRHVQFTFLIKTSEVVCRQLYKHQVGCGYTGSEFREAATVWNELSGRYVEYSDEFHKPTLWRQQSSNNKQASLRNISIKLPEYAERHYVNLTQIAHATYKDLLALGVCREQARMVLPISFMQTFTWTASLEATIHFINLRKHASAQVEICKVAEALSLFVEQKCPETFKILLTTD